MRHTSISLTYFAFVKATYPQSAQAFLGGTPARLLLFPTQLVQRARTGRYSHQYGMLAVSCVIALSDPH